jgi:hypothetical protein
MNKSKNSHIQHRLSSCSRQPATRIASG